MNELSLFSGASGGLLGSKILGWHSIGYVENNPYCQKIIKQRIKDCILDAAPIFGDIRKFIVSGLAEAYTGLVDIITAGFPCSPSVSLEKDSENQTLGICGLPPSSAFALYDLDSHSWRTSQASLLTGTWEEFSGTWPRAGMASDGLVWERTTSERIIDENDFGFWPTPNKTDGMRTRFTPKQIKRAKISHEDRGIPLGSYLARTLAEDYGASQTPTLTEVLMMLPLGWTGFQPLEMPKFLSAWLTPFRSYLKELLNK
jgi:hypothetical protein